MWQSCLLLRFEVCLNSSIVLTCIYTAAAYVWSLCMTYSSCFYPESHATIRFDSTPTLQQLDALVVDEVASNWDRMALHLGVEPSCIDIVRTNHPSDCVRACRDVMSKWLQGDRNTGNEMKTWHTVYNALQTSGYRTQAELLRGQIRDLPETPLSTSEPSEELFSYRPRFASVARPLNGKYIHIYITLLWIHAMYILYINCIEWKSCMESKASLTTQHKWRAIYLYSYLM